MALESGDVIEVETWNSESKTPRLTHIWYVNREQTLLLEAGTPENPWVKDLSEGSKIYLRGDGMDGEYNVQLVPSPEAHLEIRTLMRNKYGWRDKWISTLFDVGNSFMIKATLRPESAE